MKPLIAPLETLQRDRGAKCACAATVLVMGVLVGLVGVEHGVGEILQGPKAPDGIVVKSWPDTAAFEVVNGEPALTLIPNLLVSGVASVAVSIVVIIWSVRFFTVGGNVAALAGLSVLLLVVGGGFGPPLIGLIVAAGTALSSSPGRTQGPGSIGRALAPMWVWLLAATVLGFLSLVPGAVVVSWATGYQNAVLVAALGIFSFVALVLALMSAAAADSITQRPPRGSAHQPAVESRP